jgi:hypothetical protein
MGQQAVRLGGDLFQGRDRALTKIQAWFESEQTAGVPLVITAQPGAGKSAVVARAVLKAEEAMTHRGLAFHARGATIDKLVDAVARLIGSHTPGSWQALIRVLPKEFVDDRMLVAIDALDEAATPADLRELRSFIRELAYVDWVRVVVGTRPLAIGDMAYRRGSHLHSLGVLYGLASKNLIDLDADLYFDQSDLDAYAGAVLSQEGFVQPTPPGGAWETYRSDNGLRGRVADLISKRAGRNYLVAAMAALPVSQDTEMVVDPSAVGFDPTSIPASVGDALTKYLEGLHDDEKLRVTALLTALAYGRGEGLEDQR